MNFEINAENTRLLRAVRTLAHESIGPRAFAYDRDGRFPAENFTDLHRLELLALPVPREHGGRGAGLSSNLLLKIMIVEELSKACSSTGHCFHSHTIPLELIDALATPRQKTRFFSEVTETGAVFGIWASERGGKTIFDMKTTARRVPGGYVLDGEKFFSTNSAGATWGQVWAVTPDSDSKLVIAMVRMNAEGVTRCDDWNPLGQRATASGTTRFNKVFVPDEHVIGEPGAYYQMPLFGPYIQLGWTAVYVGIAAGAFETGLVYVKEKSRPWGESSCERAIDDPYTQNHVADMSTAIESARLMLYRAACRLEAAAHDLTQRAEAAVAVYQAKVLATEVVLDVSSRIFQIGGARMAAEAPVSGNDLYWRNARTFTLHDPVDYRRQRIGKYLLAGEEPPIGWF